MGCGEVAGEETYDIEKVLVVTGHVDGSGYRADRQRNGSFEIIK